MLVVPVADGRLDRKLRRLGLQQRPPDRAIEGHLTHPGVEEAFGRAAGGRAGAYASGVEAVEIPVLVAAHAMALQPVRHVLPWGGAVCLVCIRIHLITLLRKYSRLNRGVECVQVHHNSLHTPACAVAH